MNPAALHYVVLFESVNQTMWAESLLKKGDIPHKLIPVPRHISSDCGVCLRIDFGTIETARKVLAGVEGLVDIVPLQIE